MSIRRDFPDIPPVWAAGTLLAQVAVDRVVPVVPFAAMPAAAWALVGAGLALIGWSALWFRRKRTTIEPRDAPTALIVEGPFRLNRNPIYTGMTAILLGAGLWLGSLSAVAVAFAFPWIVTRRFVIGEEAALVSALGDAARAYISSTRRW